MELTTLKATTRTLNGAGALNRLRKEGGVPAVFYGNGQEPISLSIKAIDLRGILAPGKRYTLINLEIDGKGGNPAIIHDYQKDVISGEILHIDFMRITETSKVKVRIPVKLEGLPVGVKTEGGMLSQENRYIRIACAPALIPSVYTVDISDVHAGVTYYAKDIPLKDGVSLVSGPRLVVFTISKGRSEEEKTAEAAKPAAKAPAAPAKAPAKAEEKGKK